MGALLDLLHNCFQAEDLWQSQSAKVDTVKPLRVAYVCTAASKNEAGDGSDVQPCWKRRVRDCILFFNPSLLRLLSGAIGFFCDISVRVWVRFSFWDTQDCGFVIALWTRGWDGSVWRGRRTQESLAFCGVFLGSLSTSSVCSALHPRQSDPAAYRVGESGSGDEDWTRLR